MAQIREIKKRIGAVNTIRRITKTMQMIATAKFTNALQRTQAARPFTDKIAKLMGEALAGAGDFEHPLMSGPGESPRRQRLLVISSNRGLCGAYNANVLRTALAHYRQEIKPKGIDLTLETAGKKAVAFFKFQRIKLDEAHLVADQPEYDQIDRIADRYMSDFLAGEYDSVHVAFMHFVSNSRQVPEVLKLLPLEPAIGESPTGSAEPLYDFSPSPEGILDELLPLAVKTMLYQAFLDASVSEQIMRMIAMKAASDNAADLHKLLTRKYNRARQAKITTELMEVIAGAAALE